MSSVLYENPNMLPNMRTLAERFTFIRESLGLSQAEFARKIGVSRSAANQIELGITQTLKASTVTAIERLSGFSSQWIESGKGPQYKPFSVMAGDADAQLHRIYQALINLPPDHRDKIEADVLFLESLNKRDK